MEVPDRPKPKSWHPEVITRNNLSAAAWLPGGGVKTYDPRVPVETNLPYKGDLID